MYRLSSHNSHMLDACSRTVLMLAKVLDIWDTGLKRARSVTKVNKENKQDRKHWHVAA